MADELKVLFVEDEPLDVQLARHELEREGLAFASRIVTSETALHDELTRFEPDVVLCDYTIPGFSGVLALDLVHRLRPETPVLMFSGSICEETAVECLEHGATDYLMKSSLRRLGPAVRRAVTDARQRLAFEHRLEKLAHYDTLTGLPNLSQVDEIVRQATLRATASGHRVAVLVLNLDGFRFIGERLGRHLADEVLREVGVALKARSRTGDFLARVSADEFLAVLCDVADARELERIARELLATVSSAPLASAGREIRLTASAGIAEFPQDGSDFETLLAKSTEALHEAKTRARGDLLFHSADPVRYAHSKRRMETDLLHAIRHDGLTLHYQPQFDIRTGQACGVEALARWYRADGESVSPAVFIPAAEESGLIGELGVWALRRACKTIACWPHSYRSRSPLCVNVSTRQICPEFTSVIEQALDEGGLAPERLELEITESVLIGDTELTLDCLAAWKRLGVRIAVDDFGTGYSSLNYLSRLPVDRLKMDKSLIQRMTTESREAAIVRAVVALGRDLRFDVLAEGVETEEQLQMLADLGCQQAQGYLLTPPAPPDEACVLMTHKWGNRAPPLWAGRHSHASLHRKLP